MKELVIVGGGPVGLWTAIQMKKRNTNLNIKIYERHDTYQREHILMLDHWSMILYNKNIKDKNESDFIEEVTGKSLKNMQLSFPKSLFIKTQDLENALKKYALSLGVEIIKKRIKDTVEVEKMHPNCKHFIAADGAKSLMRVRLLGKENVDFEEVQNIIELKFSIKGKAKKGKNNFFIF